jgi:hypothetical protein
VDVATAFVAYGQSSEAIEPGEGALDHPAMFAELFFTVDAPTGNAWQDTAPPAGIPTARIIVAFIRVTFLGPPLRTAGFSADRRYGIEHIFEHGAVMDVGAGEAHGKRNAAPVSHQVPLRARFAAIRWIWARGRAPFLAGMAEASIHTRSKSIRFAPRRRRSNSWCNLSHTPACCHSRKRRQQVTPEPHPNCGGRSCQAMPVRSTNRIPLRAARSAMRGRPPRGFGGGDGSIFSMIGQRPSGIRTGGIPPYESPIPRRTRVLKGALNVKRLGPHNSHY